MTALDIWMSCCRVFVCLAIFEYAIQLKIRFGARSKIGTTRDRERKTKMENKCRKIDQYALMILSGIYILTVCIYFYKFYYVSRRS